MILALLALTATLLDTPAPPRAEVNDGCLACHGDSALSQTLPSGETRSLHVDAVTFGTSVHGEKLSCLDCHPDMSELPHPERKLGSGVRRGAG